MTLGEIVCEAGVSTLKEYMCLEKGIPGDIFYYGTMPIVEEEGLSLEDTKDTIHIEEAIMIQEQEDEVLIDKANVIIVEEQEIIDGIC